MFKLMFVAAVLAVAAAAPAPQAAIVPILKSGDSPASTSHAAHLVAPIAYTAPITYSAYSPVAYSAYAPVPYTGYIAPRYNYVY